jgi:hypothetical protein
MGQPFVDVEIANAELPSNRESLIAEELSDGNGRLVARLRVVVGSADGAVTSTLVLLVGENIFYAHGTLILLKDERHDERALRLCGVSRLYWM